MKLPFKKLSFKNSEIRSFFGVKGNQCLINSYHGYSTYHPLTYPREIRVELLALLRETNDLRNSEKAGYLISGVGTLGRGVSNVTNPNPCCKCFQKKIWLIVFTFLSPNTTSEQKYWSLSFHDRPPHVLDGFCHPQKLTCPDRSTLSKKSNSAWTRSRFFWYSFRDWPVTSSPRLFQSPDFKSTSVLTHEAPVANVGFLKSSRPACLLPLGNDVPAFRWAMTRNLRWEPRDDVRGACQSPSSCLQENASKKTHIVNPLGPSRGNASSIRRDHRGHQGPKSFNRNCSGVYCVHPCWSNFECSLLLPSPKAFHMWRGLEFFKVLLYRTSHDCLHSLDVRFLLLWPNNPSKAFLFFSPRLIPLGNVAYNW